MKLMILSALLVASANASSPVESTLHSQLRALEAIRPHLEEPAIPRWMVLKRSTEQALETLQASPAGVGKIFKAHLSLVIRYRRSRAFFDENVTDVTREQFETLISTTEQIARL